MSFKDFTYDEIASMKRPNKLSRMTNLPLTFKSSTDSKELQSSCTNCKLHCKDGKKSQVSMNNKRLHTIIPTVTDQDSDHDTSEEDEKEIVNEKSIERKDEENSSNMKHQRRRIIRKRRKHSSSINSKHPETLDQCLFSCNVSNGCMESQKYREFLNDKAN